MSDGKSKDSGIEDKSSPTRRKVLGTLGATAGAVTGARFLGTASADSGEINGVQNTEQINSLLSEVGNPKIVNKRRWVKEVDELKILETNLETNIGTVVHLRVLNSNGGKFDQNTTSVTFEIENLTREIREELPPRFSSIPRGVSVSVKQQEEEIIVVTTLTKEEKEQLGEITGSDEFVAQYVNGYYHVITTDDVRYKVSSSQERPEIGEASVETLATTQINQDACYDCVANSPLASCGTCLQHCMPGDAFNPLRCPYCIADKCADSDLVACSKCIASAAGL